MAASKAYFARSNYCFLSTESTASLGSDSVFELNESDVWNDSVTTELRKSVPSSRISKKSSSAKANRRSACETASSLPVNVPDWSKILKNDYTENRRRDSDDDDFDDDDDCDDVRLPPHEFLARTKTASFSVHEGFGRTLKGRDLSRVRNAIWEKIGFED